MKVGSSGLKSEIQFEVDLQNEQERKVFTSVWHVFHALFSLRHRNKGCSVNVTWTVKQKCLLPVCRMAVGLEGFKVAMEFTVRFRRASSNHESLSSCCAAITAGPDTRKRSSALYGDNAVRNSYLMSKFLVVDPASVEEGVVMVVRGNCTE